jgi:WD40 repeat protein
MAQASPRLAFSHRIGHDWRDEAPQSTHWMNFVAISDDGQTVVSNGDVPGIPGATGSAVGLWTFPSGEFLRSAAGHPMTISADFQYLATQSGVWNLRTGRETFHVAGQADIVTGAAFSPTGAFVALVGTHAQAQISVLNSVDGSTISSFGTRHAQAVAFHPDNQTLASGHWNNVTLWNAHTGARLALLTSPPRSVDPTGYHRDGRYIIGLGFSHDGEIMAAGSDDGELQLWNVTTRTLLHVLKIGWSSAT